MSLSEHITKIDEFLRTADRVEFYWLTEIRDTLTKIKSNESAVQLAIDLAKIDLHLDDMSKGLANTAEFKKNPEELLAKYIVDTRMISVERDKVMDKLRAVLE